MKKLYAFENGNDTVIAYSILDAVRVWEGATGEKYSLEELGEFEEVSDDTEYTLYEEELIVPDPVPERSVVVAAGDGWTKRRAKIRDWANARGRCLLGSIEY